MRNTIFAALVVSLPVALAPVPGSAQYPYAPPYYQAPYYQPDYQRPHLQPPYQPPYYPPAFYAPPPRPYSPGYVRPFPPVTPTPRYYDDRERYRDDARFRSPPPPAASSSDRYRYDGRYSLDRPVDNRPLPLDRRPGIEVEERETTRQLNNDQLSRSYDDYGYGYGYR